MARRKAYEKIDINVEPFLSIMAIVLKLISLILVVIVMRIAMNPKAKRIVAIPGLFSGHGNTTDPKIPYYIDCGPEGLVLYSSDLPNGTPVGWDDLQRPDNALNQFLDKVEKNKKDEYIVVMVRPRSVKFYRTVRNLITKNYSMDIGYDAIDSEFKVDWRAAEKALGVSTD